MMDGLEHIPDSEDLHDAHRVRCAAYDLEKQGGDATTLHARADEMFLHIARYLVARELPDVDFPTRPVREGVSYVCGGTAPNTRDLCRELVWLYGCEDDGSGMRQHLIDEKLMFLDVFCRALSSQTRQSAPEPQSDTG